MSNLKSRRELLIKIRDERLEMLVRNEIDVIFYKAEDKYVNTADAKKQAREARDKATDNVRGLKRTIEIIYDFLNIAEE